MSLHVNQLVGFGAGVAEGGSADTVNLVGGFTSNAGITPGGTSCSYRLTNGGDEVKIGSGGTVDIGDWVIPKGNAGNYEARLTVNSGSAMSSGAATGTWLALTSTLTWTLTQTGLGSKSSVCTIEVRYAADGFVMASAVVTMEVEMASP